VQPHFVDGQGAVCLLLRDVRVRDVLPVHDVDRAVAEDAEAVVGLADDRGVLVDADAENARVLGDGDEQAADALALGKCWSRMTPGISPKPGAICSAAPMRCDSAPLPETSIVSHITEAPAEVPATAPRPRRSRAPASR
jgi:hypothetical protein